MRKRYFAAFAFLLIVCFCYVAKYEQSANNSNDYLVSVAVDAMKICGHGALLPGSGLNTSTKSPFVSQKTPTTAVVTIPYACQIGPVVDPTVNLIRDPHTQDWEAVSFTNGGGVLHAIDWHPE